MCLFRESEEWVLAQRVKFESKKKKLEESNWAERRRGEKLLDNGSLLEVSESDLLGKVKSFMLEYVSHSLMREKSFP